MENEIGSQPKTNKKLKVCKHCGAQIARSAKTCPSCGGKNSKPFYLKWWFITIVVLVLLTAIGGTGSSTSSVTQTGGQAKISSVANATPKPTPTPKEYITYSIAEMMDDLNTNALKATDKYKNQNVRITGRLNVIDSSGKYISIVRDDTMYEIVGVTCYIKNSDQRTKVMEMSVGDQVTLCGKITTVGEIFGYYLDIDEIS